MEAISVSATVFTRKNLVGILPFGILLFLFGMSIWGLATVPIANAQGIPNSEKICRAALVIDRSGSVGSANVERIRNQIRRLFQPTGLYNERIELAFWTFSNTTGVDTSTGNGGFAWIGNPPAGSNPDPNYSARNFNAPYHSYVSSKGETPSTFNTMLNSIVSTGGTNYEQGFGYQDNVRNPALNDMINETDIIVFMTDGAPNAGGGLGMSAAEAGRIAAKKHQDAGRTIIGGSIGSSTSQRRTINYVVSGDYNNNNSSFLVSTNYGDLAAVLDREITKSCNNVIPPEVCQYNANIPIDSPDCVPPAPAPYSLTPSVTSTGAGVISGSDSAGFTYKVNNSSMSTPSDQTPWSVTRLVLPRGQSTDRLDYVAGENYRDNYGCTQLVALAGSGAECSEVASGTKVFGQGDTTMTATELGSANSAAIDDRWQVGTKLCYVFAIAKPTENNTPRDRYSRVVCVVVGKRPTVHITGGDVTIGSYFSASDITSDTLPGAKGSITTKTGTINKTFGSWAEYAITAPGAVSGIASGAGFEGGYDGAVGSSQLLWSRLTFANKDNEFGNFTGANSMKPAQNFSSYFLTGRTPVADLTTVNSISMNGGSVVSGVYQKSEGNILLEASTLEKGKLVILNVPNGTVTINGNISYTGGGYSSLSEIPQFVVIAKNIVINASVTNIDAWLIGRAGDGSGGTISTCERTPPLTSEICNAPLTINGPVVAKQLNLRRTGGSGIAGASSDAAETFNLRADAYLWGFSEGRSSVRAQTTQTIELPPRF